jgi:glycosyltransferase involved in cell wall biosynthesis
MGIFHLRADGAPRAREDSLHFVPSRDARIHNEVGGAQVLYNHRPVLVSVVTPSYQQGRFIERTLDSVWRQRPPVEHIVMDGGSTDGTLAILERWKDRITFSAVRTASDRRLNAGIALLTVVLAYLNSDDVYYTARWRPRSRRSSSILRRCGLWRRRFIDTDDRVIGSYPTEEWSLRATQTGLLPLPAAVFFQRGARRRTVRCAPSVLHGLRYWLRLDLRGLRFRHIGAARRVAYSPETKTVRLRKEALRDQRHAEVHGTLDSWLANFAYAPWMEGREGTGAPISLSGASQRQPHSLERLSSTSLLRRELLHRWFADRGDLKEWFDFFAHHPFVRELVVSTLDGTGRLLRVRTGNYRAEKSKDATRRSIALRMPQ